MACGVLVFPFGFCATAYIIGLWVKIAVRCVYRPRGRTPSIFDLAFLDRWPILVLLPELRLLYGSFFRLFRLSFTVRIGCFCQLAISCERHLTVAFIHTLRHGSPQNQTVRRSSRIGRTIGLSQGVSFCFTTLSWGLAVYALIVP